MHRARAGDLSDLNGFVAGFRVGRLFVDLAAAPAWLVGSGWPPLVGGAAGWLAVAVAARAALPRARA